MGYIRVIAPSKNPKITHRRQMMRRMKKSSIFVLSDVTDRRSAVRPRRLGHIAPIAGVPVGRKGVV